jgi:hypothetical protein
MSQATQKVVILLTESKDWDEWYEVIRSTAVRKGVFRLIDATKTEAPSPLEKPQRPLPSGVKAGVTSLVKLEPLKQALFRVLFDDYKDRAREFEQQEKALNKIFLQITDTTARPLRTYFRQLNTPYEILQALKKRLEPTALTRSYDLVKEYQALKKVPRYSEIELWLTRWETTYADALAINLPDVRDNRALWDFIAAVKGVDSGWANSFQNVVWLGLQKDPNDWSPLTNAIEASRNNLRISKAGSKATSVASFAAFQGDSPDSESSTGPL